MNEAIEKIKEYLKIINTNIDEIEKNNTGLVDFVIEEMLDRVMLYLGRKDIPKSLYLILAKISDTGLKKCLREIEVSKEDSTGIEENIVSISDNGQSISYSNEVKKYFVTTSDEELFTGFSSLLARYRRVNVVHSKDDENENS